MAELGTRSGLEPNSLGRGVGDPERVRLSALREDCARGDEVEGMSAIRRRSVPLRFPEQSTFFPTRNVEWGTRLMVCSHPFKRGNSLISFLVSINL